MDRLKAVIERSDLLTRLLLLITAELSTELLNPELFPEELVLLHSEGRAIAQANEANLVLRRLRTASFEPL